MERVSQEAFESDRVAVAAAALATPGIAAYCSGSDWLLPANEHLHPDRELLIFADADRENWLVLADGPLFQIPDAIQPLEAAWTFACPFLGANATTIIDQAIAVAMASENRGKILLIGGMPRETAMYFEAFRRFAKIRKLRTFDSTDCQTASLEGGWEGYLSRRSSKFRASVRRVETRAREAGISFCCLGADGPLSGSEFADAFNRLLEVESRSWKHTAGVSVFSLPEHRAFYRGVMWRAARDGRFRLVLAQRDGDDLAYVSGAVMGSVYRGFQMGYDAAFKALALGNAAQFVMIRQAAREGICCYDFGMAIDYKERWAEEKIELINLLVLPR